MELHRSVVMRPLAAAVPYSLWLWFWRAKGLIRGYGSLALMGGSGLALFALLAWNLSLDNQDGSLPTKRSCLSAPRAAWPSPKRNPNHEIACHTNSKLL
jgi:hypothetical protein